ncbi:MAG: glutamate synthase-related protein, partial [Nitrospirota bacterium]
ADNIVVSDFSLCTGCHRCEAMCPTGCITIKRNTSQFREHANWKAADIKNIYKQAATGGVLLTGIGCDKDLPIYWDHILLDACQVTNPSIDPLREPMELRTFLGRKPDTLEFEEKAGKISLKTELAPQLVCDIPILFSAMSYGAVNLNFCESLARAAEASGTYYNTGEGGLHRTLFKYGKNTIVQV